MERNTPAIFLQPSFSFQPISSCSTRCDIRTLLTRNHARWLRQLRTFECPKCEDIEVERIVDPLEKASTWLSGELSRCNSSKELDQGTPRGSPGHALPVPCVRYARVIEHRIAPAARAQ